MKFTALLLGCCLASFGCAQKNPSQGMQFGSEGTVIDNPSPLPGADAGDGTNAMNTGAAGAFGTGTQPGAAGMMAPVPTGAAGTGGIGGDVGGAGAAGSGNAGASGSGAAGNGAAGNGAAGNGAAGNGAAGSGSAGSGAAGTGAAGEPGDD